MIGFLLRKEPTEPVKWIKKYPTLLNIFIHREGILKQSFAFLLYNKNAPLRRAFFNHQVELVGFEPTSKHGMDKLSTRLVLLVFL